jgi:acyl-CoA synthetase (AMP-forming)/AMP-acid ligase II
LTRSLATLLEGDAGDVVAYADDIATTRGELRALVSEFSLALQDAKLRDCAIGVLGANTPATIAAWFAVWDSGGAFVPLNPRVPAAERDRATEATGVVALLDAAAGEVRRLAPAEPRLLQGDEAIIQFTSGTTGRPKAVPLRHDTILGLLDGVIGTLRGTQPGARARMPNLVPVSLSLWAGIYQVLFAFTLGVPVVLMEQFSAPEFARLVREYGIRSSVLPPAAMVMLSADPNVTSLEPLRYVRSVSAPLSPTHARAFHDRFGVGILNGYGQTELGGEVVGWSAADWKQFGAAKLGAVGRPHAGIEVRVRDDELQVRSSSAPRVDPVSQLDSTSALADRITEDGWLRTGDLARIDDDGFVWIEGRVSSMINRGGLKVFPDEVEEHLREHPGVHDAAVAGVVDDRLGEVPWAFLVVEPGAEVDADALREWSRARMAPYKVPAGFTFLDELPRNEIGKLLRQDLPTGRE